jgi:Leucine-rich repeat (LRR) protein
MAPGDQVKAVVAELQRRNPGYDGQVESNIHEGEVLGLIFKDAPFHDLVPLQALPRLQRFNNRRQSYVPERPPLDLAPLKGLPLTNLDLAVNQVTDLTPLKGKRLEVLDLHFTGVTDLTSVEGMPLKVLKLNWTRVTDLTPLRGMPLTILCIYETGVTDLTPLRAMSLTSMELSLKPYKGLEVVRTMKSLETINQKPAAEFWKEFDRQVPLAKDLPPLSENWLKFVQELPAEKQVGAVVEELKRRNPGWSGEVVEKREDGKGLRLELRQADPVGDLTPVRALPDLTELWYHASGGIRGRLADAAQFKGLGLKHLFLYHPRMADLAPLRGMALEYLGIYGSWVTDLSPLEGMPLKHLDIGLTYVSDLSPLRGMPLQSLGGLRLQPYRGIEHIRAIPTLSAINGKPAADFWKEYDAKVGPPPQGFAPLDGDWLKAVREMKREEQVQAVVEELKRRNPGFSGKVTAFPEQGEVIGLRFEMDEYAMRDLTPLQALPKLESVTHVLYAGLAGPLDITPLKGLRLKGLRLQGTGVTDLTPLRRMPLEALTFGHTPVADLSPLEGMPLTLLSCISSGVTDLTPLKGMKLEVLHIWNTAVTDLTPLEGMPLKVVQIDFRPYRGMEVLRRIKTLATINDKPAADFWKEFDEHFGPTVQAPPPLDPAWLKRVQALPPEDQVKAAAEELARRNPGYSADKVKAVRPAADQLVVLLNEAEPVADLRAVTALPDLVELHYLTLNSPTNFGRLTNLTQLQGLRLRSLTLSGPRVVDLAPLKGMPLKHLDIGRSWVADLTPLQGMPLENFDCHGSYVADLTPLQAMPLHALNLGGCRQVRDLAPLRGIALGDLTIVATGVTDLTPLQGIPLKRLGLDLKPYRGIEHVRAMPTLETINSKPAADFWKEYDAKVGLPK